ncbi:MAG: ATP-binding protein [Bacteroidales bacterium]|nr:ATP-binding protein [Bacteroidales bacterium]
MKSILKYFLKAYKFNSNIESIRTKSFLLFLLSGLLLLIAFMIKTGVSGNCSSLPVQASFVFLILLSLFFIKRGNQQIVENSLAIIIILVEILSVFLNFSGAAAFNFFVDEFYILLSFLLFTAMFASRFVLGLNTVLVIATSITAFIYKKDDFPPEIISELKFGLSVYIFVILLIFIFSYLYTNIIHTAIKEISDHADDADEKNIQLKKHSDILSKQKEELEKAKKKAEESDKLKSTFLANMSHEIRTPMNAILGFTEILTGTKLDEKQAEYIKIIENSGKHLLELINDIIDISKLESNQLKIEESKCNLNHFIEEMVTFFELSLHKDHKTNLKITKSLGLEKGEDIILTDTTRLRQILINLTGNAIKFTMSGSINIAYTKQSDNELLFSIKDTGIGISQEQLPIIFERFRQADETTTKKFGGTGLGLAISKACTELLGGKIWAISEKDEGSTFYFTIPYKPFV